MSKGTAADEEDCRNHAAAAPSSSHAFYLCLNPPRGSFTVWVLEQELREMFPCFSHGRSSVLLVCVERGHLRHPSEHAGEMIRHESCTWNRQFAFTLFNPSALSTRRCCRRCSDQVNNKLDSNRFCCPQCIYLFRRGILTGGRRKWIFCSLSSLN